jgi:hypothetical protein
MSNAVNITATAQLALGAKRLKGFYVNSTSSGTLVLKEGDTNGVAITGTITPAIGWHDFPVSVTNGLHATIASTLNVTFIFDP